MLRTLREQRWYVFLWLPFSTFLGLLAIWFWVTFHIIGGWTIQYNAAPKWGLLSAGTLVLCVLSLTLLFPRRQARDIRITAICIGLIALLLLILYYANTHVISYEVSDVDDGPLEGIPVYITHHANGVALTWFPGKALLRTDKQGKAAIRIFKSEHCGANINDRLGKAPGYGNSIYSEDNAFFDPASDREREAESLFGSNEIVEHSYMLEFQGGPPSVSQRCIESPFSGDARVIRIYLRRRDSYSLPPYFDQIAKENSADPSVQKARLMSLGGSIEGFNHLDELLSDVSRNDPQQDVALYSLSLLATQISEIAGSLSDLSAADNTRQNRYTTKELRENCSLALYLWLSGTDSPPPLSPIDRIAYIRKRMDEATQRLIDALHPAMLKKKLAYRILDELRENARPAVKFYPEVFEKGTAEAREGALATIIAIAPSANDIAFLIRSKKPEWIERASAISMNSKADKLAEDLETLENLKSQEKDPEIIAAFDRVIGPVSQQLARDRADEANKPVSDIIPRYPVIDLGTKNCLHPLKVTNSGYVLGRNDTAYYVWFEGKETMLRPKNVGGVLAAEDINEDGTVTGTEMDAIRPGGTHHSANIATWEKGINPPKLTPTSIAVLRARKSASQAQPLFKNLPQTPNLSVIPVAANSAVELLPAKEGQPAQSAQLVMATEVIGNGIGGGYVWEMEPTLSTTKIFDGPTLLNDLLPGEPRTSRWKVISVASINDGGTIVGTAIYTPLGPNDSMPAGPHGVMLMPLAIVRETTPGSGDYEPITDNGLDDNAMLPIFASAPPGTPASEKSDPKSDGQGIFYIQIPGSIATSITLKSGDNKMTVQAAPVKGRPNLLRTGKLVLIAQGDPFRAPDITTIEVQNSVGGGNPTLELQKYDRTIVR